MRGLKIACKSVSHATPAIIKLSPLLFSVKRHPSHVMELTDETKNIGAVVIFGSQLMSVLSMDLTSIVRF